jgi:hypothetical protein
VIQEPVNRDAILDAEIAKELADVELTVWRHALIAGKVVDVLCIIDKGHYSARLYHIYGSGDNRSVAVSYGYSDVNIECAINQIVEDHEEDYERQYPTGFNAMPAGTEMDHLVALAIVQRGRYTPTFVEVLVPRDITHLTDLLVNDFEHNPANRLRYMQATESDELPILVRRKWYKGFEVWRPSRDFEQAQEVMQEIANDIHGGAHLSFDGDCFCPPPWRCSFTGWRIMGEKPIHSFGDTAQLAVCRCLLKKDLWHRKEILSDLTQEAQDMGMYESKDT